MLSSEKKIRTLWIRKDQIQYDIAEEKIDELAKSGLIDLKETECNETIKHDEKIQD